MTVVPNEPHPIDLLDVADSSPLIYLSRIGLLEVLASTFGDVVVPAMVWEEVVGVRKGAPGVAALLSAP